MERKHRKVKEMEVRESELLNITPSKLKNKGKKMEDTKCWQCVYSTFI